MEQQGEYKVKEELSLAQTLILDKIRTHHVGLANRISKKKLLMWLYVVGGIGMSERTLREELAGLRENGYPVLMSNKGGFYWPEEPEQVFTWINKEIDSRTAHLHKQGNAMRRHIHVHFGQISLGE